MIKITAIISISSFIVGAFNYRESSPINLFPYNYAVVNNSVPGFFPNPAYLPLSDYLFLNFSMDKPYSLENITSNNLRLGYGFGNWGFQFGWNRMGIDQYSENIVDLSAGYMPLKYLSFGIGINYYNISISTEEILLKRNLFDAKVSVLCIPFHWLHISFYQDNMVSLFIKKRRDLLFPEWSTGVSVSPVRGLSFIWNINRTAYGYINNFIVSANVNRYFSLSGGYSKETSSYSAAFSFVYKYIRASYGLRYHSYLGSTHAMGLSLTGIPLKLESLNYRKRFKERPKRYFKKININKCSIEEIRKLPFPSDIFAERIIKYRSTIGPVTMKALFQVGMDNKMVKGLLNHIYGLAAERKNRFNKYFKMRKRGNRIYSREKRVKLFQKLLSLGVKTSTAFKISKLAASETKIQFIIKINSFAGLDKNTKRKILNYVRNLY
ncbi:ComEA family DNA-binding protein [Spirochaetota bacterium]